MNYEHQLLLRLSHICYCVFISVRYLLANNTFHCHKSNTTVRLGILRALVRGNLQFR